MLKGRFCDFLDRPSKGGQAHNPEVLRMTSSFLLSLTSLSSC